MTDTHRHLITLLEVRKNSLLLKEYQTIFFNSFTALSNLNIQEVEARRE